MKSETPLPPAPEALRELRQKTAAALRVPAREPVPPLPAAADAISGAVYRFPVNLSRLDTLSLRFGRQEASVTVTYLGEELTFPVGLDGRYALGNYGPLHLPAGTMGKWVSEDEFQLDLNFIANINHYTLALRFAGDTLEMAATEASGLIRNAKLTGERQR